VIEKNVELVHEGRARQREAPQPAPNGAERCTDGGERVLVPLLAPAELVELTLRELSRERLPLQPFELFARGE